jgi:S-formylglutathione hydrolase FrmB
MAFTVTAIIASFGGRLLKLRHHASTTGCEMALNLYLPPQAVAQGNSPSAKSKIPVLFYLSGLTCTGDNCAEKGFFQHGASKRGMAVVYPDTSPREYIIELLVVLDPSLFTSIELPSLRNRFFLRGIGFFNS